MPLVLPPCHPLGVTLAMATPNFQNYSGAATYYQLLRVDPGAPLFEIEKQFRMLAKLHHPDKVRLNYPSCGNLEERLAEATNFMAQINHAYEILCNSRSEYDRYLEEARVKSSCGPSSNQGSTVFDSGHRPNSNPSGGRASGGENRRTLGEMLNEVERIWGTLDLHLSGFLGRIRKEVSPERQSAMLSTVKSLQDEAIAARSWYLCYLPAVESGSNHRVVSGLEIIKMILMHLHQIQDAIDSAMDRLTGFMRQERELIENLNGFIGMIPREIER